MDFTFLDLNLIWFVLIGVLFSGYAMLDGFDLGVGALHLLILFVALVYGLTIAKVGTDPYDALGVPGNEASQ